MVDSALSQIGYSKLFLSVGGFFGSSFIGMSYMFFTYIRDIKKGGDESRLIIREMKETTLSKEEFQRTFADYKQNLEQKVDSLRELQNEKIKFIERRLDSIERGGKISN